MAIFLAVSTLVLGLSVGFIVGDQRILLPEKDQVLLDKGTLAGMSYVLGRFAEDRDPAKAREAFEDALKYNPSFEQARSALKKLEAKMK